MRSGSHSSEPARPSRAGLAFTGFLIAAAFFLVTEHRAHLYGIWPYLLFLLCPLMHVFMHHGHDHGGGSDEPGRGDAPDHRHHHGGAR